MSQDPDIHYPCNGCGAQQVLYLKPPQKLADELVKTLQAYIELIEQGKAEYISTKKGRDLLYKATGDVI